MEKSLKPLVSLFLAALLIAVPFLGVHAAVSSEADRPETRGVYYDPNEELLSEYDREKLLAFWSIVNEETGVSNGEACFISEYPASWLDEIGGSEYGGTAMTPLVKIDPYLTWYGDAFMFDAGYELNHLEPLPGGAPGDRLCQVWPDLYGDLDLAGTRIASFRSDPGGPGIPSHITSILLDNCLELDVFTLRFSDYCREVSALNCPAIRSFIVQNSVVGSIAFGPSCFEKDFNIRAFGAGSVGVYYRNFSDEPICTLHAYPAEDFLGWYCDGALISTERTCEVFDGGNYVACYGGDADGNGSVTVTDAIIVLREAMGLGRDGEVSPMLDVNGSGSVDVSAAIMILRFAMGII